MIHDEEILDIDFLRSYYIDLDVVDEIYNTALNEKNFSQPGLSGGKVQPEIKSSFDLRLDDYPRLHEKYMLQLQKCLEAYMDDYPWCNNYNPFTTKDFTNIQRYEPGQGFHEWHTERGGVDPVECNRHLVFMTYLNDVTDAGETEWLHQNIKVRAAKGRTVIWPADWTFTHRGIPSPTQEKVIVTGWLSYYSREGDTNESRKNLGSDRIGPR